MDEAHSVRELREIREEIADHFSRLAAGFEVPEGLDQVALLALEGDEFFRAGQGLAVAFHQFGFVIERVHMAERAGAEDQQDAAGFGSEVRGARRVRSFGADLRADGRIVGEQALLGEQTGERDAAEAVAGELQKRTAVEELAAGGGERWQWHGAGVGCVRRRIARLMI